MRTLAERAEPRRLPIMLLILIALSLFVGITAGTQTRLNLKLLFYTLILSNLLVVAYTLLIRNMTYGVLVYLYSLTFLNFYWRITIPGRWPDLDLPRLTFVFIWFVFLLELALGKRRLLPRTRIEIAMLGVLFAILASMLTIGEVQIRQFLNGFAIPYAMFIVAKNVFVRQRDLDKFIYWFAVPLSIYFPINHMFEHYRMTQFVFPRYILSREVAGQVVFWGERTMGVFLQPVATGMAMISMFLLSLYGLSKLKGFLPKILSLFITALTPIAVFFIYTRSVYLGFFVAMMVLLVFSKKLKIFALIIIIAVVLGILGNWSNVTTEEREVGGLATKDTAMQRLVLMQASVRMFADHPFLGVGFQRFAQESQHYVRQIRTTVLGYRETWMGKGIKQHNQFLNMLTETGLVGVIPLIALYYCLFRILWKARTIHSETYDSEFVVVVWAILAEYMINTLFMEPRFFEFMNVLPFLLAGIIVGGYQRARSRAYATGERSIAREGTLR